MRLNGSATQEEAIANDSSGGHRSLRHSNSDYRTADLRHFVAYEMNDFDH
jgi:hypothetical protein